MRQAGLFGLPEQLKRSSDCGDPQDTRSAVEVWPDQPAKAAQKDTDARWTLKFAT